MIDPITAFATAQAAVAGIQKALKLGKDISGCIREFTTLFEASDSINKAVNDGAKTGKSDTAQALEWAMQQNKLREDMENLKHNLVYGGYPEIWDMMLQKRMEIQRARKKREAEERAAALKRRQENQMVLLYMAITVAFVTMIIGGVYILMQVT